MGILGWRVLPLLPSQALATDRHMIDHQAPLAVAGESWNPEPASATTIASAQEPPPREFAWVMCKALQRQSLNDLTRCVLFSKEWGE
jgi:hypothetical protein